MKSEKPTRSDKQFYALGTTLLILVSLLPALAYAMPSEKDWKQFNNATINSFVIPAYQAFSDKATAFRKSTETLCNNPNDNSFERAKQSFHLAMDSWQRIQNITFGPIEFSMRSHSIQFWPDKKNHVGKHLGALLASEDPVLLSEERFMKSRVSVRGLPAAERLLFGDQALSKLQEHSFACLVLTTISLNIERIASALSTEWQQHMRKQFADAKQLDGYFEDDIDAATALLKTMIEPLEVIRDLKIKRPIGSQFGKAKYKRLESWRSQRSLRNIQLNIQSLEAMFQGSVSNTANNSINNSINNSANEGLAALLPKETAIHISQLYRDIERGLSQLDQTLEEAVLNERGYQSVVNIYNKIGQVHTELEKVVADLGIHLGFNSRDGD